MSSERDFAEALAAALGPLYRVSIVAAAGVVEASFGDLDTDRTSHADIPLPGVSKSLRIEVDASALEASQRVVMSLAPKGSTGQPAPGLFTHVDRAIHQLVSRAESEMGLPIGQMSRLQKQQVVRLLDEHGAFNLRKSVETVADMLGVSRFTVYNYLDSSRGS